MKEDYQHLTQSKLDMWVGILQAQVIISEALLN
jgi:hypothetical protein